MLKSQFTTVNGVTYGFVKNYKGLYSLSLNKKAVGCKFVMDDFGNLVRLFYKDRYEHSLSVGF